MRFNYQWFISILMLLGAHGLGQSQDLLEQTPYEFPFPNHGAWIEAMAGKGLEDWSQVFDAASYERFKSQQTVRVSRITYLSDGLKIKGFLIAPTSVSKKSPLIVFNRGGTLKWSRITFWEILEFCRLAERGYVVAASYFRGCGGSEGEESLGKGDVRDVENLIRIVGALPQVDQTRIGMWGFSRGAMTTFRYLATHSKIDAAVTVGSPTDALRSHRQEEFEEHVYPQALPGFLEDKQAALRSISAYHWAESLNAETPILLLHGAKDARVLPNQSMYLAEKLQVLNRPFQLVVLKDGSHSLIEHVAEMRRQIDGWFDQYVRDGN